MADEEIADAFGLTPTMRRALRTTITSILRHMASYGTAHLNTAIVDRIIDTTLAGSLTDQVPTQWDTIVYRGSGRDLATDVLAVLSPVELLRFLDEIHRHPEPSWPIRTVPMTCQTAAGKPLGIFEVNQDRAYEYEARSPWSDERRGPTVWAFVHPEDRIICQQRWRQAHPSDTI